MIGDAWAWRLAHPMGYDDHARESPPEEREQLSTV
jgi:hypothetical protein